MSRTMRNRPADRQLRTGIVWLAMSLCVWSFASTALAQGETFDDPTPTTTDLFGRTVARDGNHLLIGAPRHAIGGDHVGQAHLFDAMTGALLRTFDDPSPTGDQILHAFASSVAIAGSYVLIGDAGHDDVPDVFDVGQVYLFDATTGALLCTFNDPAPNADGHDDFGFAVAIDGDHVLIGAPGHRIDGFSVGQAYLFDAVTCGLLETFVQPLPTGEVSYSNTHDFGASVAIDGDSVLVGAPSSFSAGSTIGQAHLFDTAGNLLQTWIGPDNPPGFAQSFFGVSVDIDGDHVLIAASTVVRTVGEGEDEETGSVGRVFLYDAVSGGLLHTFDDPTPTPRTDINVDLFGDRFGESIAIDGDNVLIGAFGDNTNGQNVGQAHLFDAAGGNLLQTFDDPTVTTEDEFGLAVAIEGNAVLIGAPGDDSNGFNIGQAHLIPIDSDGDGLPDDADPHPDDDDSDDDGIPDGQDPDTVGEAVDGLPVGEFDNQGDPNGQRNAVLAQLEAIEQLILDGDIAGALTKLNNLRKKVDGCPDLPESGETADNNDWIIDCDSQREIRELIDLLISNLGG